MAPMSFCLCYVSTDIQGHKSIEAKGVIVRKETESIRFFVTKKQDNLCQHAAVRGIRAISLS